VTTLSVGAADVADVNKVTHVISSLTITGAARRRVVGRVVHVSGTAAAIADTGLRKWSAYLAMSALALAHRAPAAGPANWTLSTTLANDITGRTASARGDGDGAVSCVGETEWRPVPSDAAVTHRRSVPQPCDWAREGISSVTSPAT
jgi:hypothetical protein